MSRSPLSKPKRKPQRNPQIAIVVSNEFREILRFKAIAQGVSLQKLCLRTLHSIVSDQDRNAYKRFIAAMQK